MGILVIESEQAGQRIDNFLFRYFNNIPKSRIYRALRKGEVRINKKRIDNTYRLKVNDELRVPPPFENTDAKEAPKKMSVGSQIIADMENRVIYEDKQLMIIDKPSRLPVHGGSGVLQTIMNIIKTMRPHEKFLELAHRLDRETSGCLLIAKKRAMLLELQQLLAARTVKKQYLTLVKGVWKEGDCKVDAPLLKNQEMSGERMVQVDKVNGKEAVTYFHPIKYFKSATLLEAKPLTGRTHQIRVHAAYLGYPIAGDEKYGDKAFNRLLRDAGLKRLFLHSASIYCELPSNQTIDVCARLDDELMSVLGELDVVAL